MCGFYFSFVLPIFILFFYKSEAEKHAMLSPVDPSHPARRDAAQYNQSQVVDLHYAETSYQYATHYAATVTWYMYHPTLVAFDQIGIEYVECQSDGIHIQFTSEEAKREAEKWSLPLVLITEGDNGQCAYDGPGGERYHPFYLESRSQINGNLSRSAAFSGYRSRWNVVAYHHEVNVGKAEANPSRDLVKRSFAGQSLQAPRTFKFSPSLNFDRQKNTSLSANVTISTASLKYGSVSLSCQNCYFEADFQLTLDTGSRILNAGIRSVSKLLGKLYRAEQALKSLLRSASQAMQQAFFKQFSQLNEQLADAMSEFYNRVNSLLSTKDSTERLQLKTEIDEAAKLVRSKSQRLLTLAADYLDNSALSASFPENTKNQVIQQVEKMVAEAQEEIDNTISSDEQTMISESQLPVCGEEEIPLRRRAIACRPRPKPTSTKLIGRLDANIDLALSLTGRGELTLADTTLFSASFAGIQIPGVVTIGPQARFISQTNLAFDRTATITIGADMQWQNIDTVITARASKQEKIRSTGFTFNRHRPSFSISPQKLSLEQHFKPQLVFGIDLSLGKQELLVGIGADVGFINTLTFSSALSKPIPDCPAGIKYDFTLSTRLEALLNTPSIAKAWLGKFFAKGQVLGLIPESFRLWEMPPYTLLKHCFGLPSSCLSPSGLPSEHALTRCSKKLASSEASFSV